MKISRAQRYISLGVLRRGTDAFTLTCTSEIYSDWTQMKVEKETNAYTDLFYPKSHNQ